jgi:hypothetical protein
MALLRPRLTQALLNVLGGKSPGFVGFPNSYATAAHNFATAYDSYARLAVDSAGDALVTASSTGFETALAQGLFQSQSPGVCASLFGLAFGQYWTPATFGTLYTPATGDGGNGIFLRKTSSKVFGVDTNSLVAALTQEFGRHDLAITDVQKADSLSAILHAAIAQVTVLQVGLDTTPPPSGPVPIVNLSPPA